MAAMRRIALVLAALVLFAAPARADGDVLVHRVTPAADAAIPFWCDWSYDWEARCYRDVDDRLPVGGEDDKVWRSALRFPLSGIPVGAAVVSAALELSFDGVCLGPRKTVRRCPARAYTIDIHPVIGADWHREREVELGPLVTSGALWARSPQRLSWDVTDLVIAWVEQGVPNDGLLLKLADGEEDFGVSGPKFPSAEFPDAALRPTLEVRYFLPGGDAAG
ncbi:MAG TPA: DNRLRE domain-containing protein [Gaiellaceae bacterium]|jgi:hypothetical protein